MAEAVPFLAVADAYKNLASILRDAYTCYNVTSISFKKIAFLETENGVFYDLSGYRVPRTHCTLKEGARIRIDQPRFKIEEDEYEVRVALHDRYLELLPPPLLQGLSEGQGQSDDGEPMEDDGGEDDDADIHLDEFFDEDILSQQFDSQASIYEDSPDVIESPPKKRRKLSTPPPRATTTTTPPTMATAATETSVQRNVCHLCGVYVGGDKRNIEKHIRKSCPKNPDVDELEAARRQKRAEKQSKKLEAIPSVQEGHKKEEGGGDGDGDGDHGGSGGDDNQGGGDCGCRGAEHGQGCSRTPIFQHGHRRLPRNIPAPHLNPDPDALAPHLLRPIIPVIQAINQQRFPNRQNRWIAGLGPPRNGDNFINSHWHRVVSKISRLSLKIPIIWPIFCHC